MRIRTIKPEFWLNEDLGRLEDFTRLVAVALLNYADDEGYFNANPELIRGQVFPFEKNSTRIQRALVEASTACFISLYSGTNGRVYGRIQNFSKHQKIDRPSPSRIKPLVNFDEPSTKAQRGIDESSLLDQGSGNRDQGAGRSDQSAKESAPTSDESWLAELAADSTYVGIDVLREHGKMVRWCTEHKKVPTRRRFINWLNRTDRPIGAAASQALISEEFRKF
jgi:hypothetical protein